MPTAPTLLAGTFTSASDCPPTPHAAVGLMPPKKYSFILSHRRGANASCTASSSIGFVGIGKTGSLFMQAALEFWAHEQLLPHAAPAPTNPCLVGARMGWHHASALLWRRAFGEAAWRAAFTFSLVRDPWARLVSHWAFHLTSKNPLDGGFLSRDERAAARANETRSIELFRSWVRHAGRTFPPGAADAWRFTTSDAHGNERAPTFNASQLSWLVDEKGRLLVDEVIRLEDLERRWPQLQERVCGLRGTAYRAARDHPAIRAMDHPSDHAPYAVYYDADASAAVGAYMAADVARFGYRPPRIAR